MEVTISPQMGPKAASQHVGASAEAKRGVCEDPGTAGEKQEVMTRPRERGDLREEQAQESAADRAGGRRAGGTAHCRGCGVGRAGVPNRDWRGGDGRGHEVPERAWDPRTGGVREP